jgi:hypothetical protein
MGFYTNPYDNYDDWKKDHDQYMAERRAEERARIALLKRINEHYSDFLFNESPRNASGNISDKNFRIESEPKLQPKQRKILRAKIEAAKVEVGLSNLDRLTAILGPNIYAKRLEQNRETYTRLWKWTECRQQLEYYLIAEKVVQKYAKYHYERIALPKFRTKALENYESCVKEMQQEITELQLKKADCEALQKDRSLELRTVQNNHLPQDINFQISQQYEAQLVQVKNKIAELERKLQAYKTAKDLNQALTEKNIKEYDATGPLGSGQPLRIFLDELQRAGYFPSESRNFSAEDQKKLMQLIRVAIDGNENEFLKLSATIQENCEKTLRSEIMTLVNDAGKQSVQLLCLAPQYSEFTKDIRPKLFVETLKNLEKTLFIEGMPEACYNASIHVDNLQRECFESQSQEKIEEKAECSYEQAISLASEGLEQESGILARVDQLFNLALQKYYTASADQKSTCFKVIEALIARGCVPMLQPLARKEEACGFILSRTEVTFENIQDIASSYKVFYVLAQEKLFYAEERLVKIEDQTHHVIPIEICSNKLAQLQTKLNLPSLKQDEKWCAHRLSSEQLKTTTEVIAHRVGDLRRAYQRPTWAILEAVLRHLPTRTPLSEKIREVLLNYAQKTQEQLQSWGWWLFNSPAIKNDRLHIVDELAAHLTEIAKTQDEKAMIVRIKELHRQALKGLWNDSALFKELHQVVELQENGKLFCAEKVLLEKAHTEEKTPDGKLSTSTKKASSTSTSTSTSTVTAPHVVMFAPARPAAPAATESLEATDGKAATPT